MTDKEQFNELHQEIQSRGKIFISFVHPHLYGPLRNLNFILKNPDTKVLDFYLREGWEQIGVDIWKETMLATQPMIMPWEMVQNSEIPPQSFDSIKEAEDYIRRKLKENKDKDKDFFYYRLGIH